MAGSENTVRVEIICAWCGRHLGHTNWRGPRRHRVTHGICGSCEEKIFNGEDMFSEEGGP